MHFHICAIGGVFEALWGDITADPATPPGIVFHPASGIGIDEAAVAQVQAQVRTRIPRAFAVCAGAAAPAGSRAGLPLPQTAEWRQAGRPGAQRACADRAHRRPGAAAAHAPPPVLRGAGTERTAQSCGDGHGAGGAGPWRGRAKRAHYLWAVLITRIYEVFPLVCPRCGGNMRILAFVTEGVQIRRILEHIGVDAQAPPIAPARGPPLWDECDAQGADGAGQGAPIDPDWGLCRARHRPHYAESPSMPSICQKSQIAGWRPRRTGKETRHSLDAYRFFRKVSKASSGLKVDGEESGGTVLAKTRRFNSRSALR